MPDKKDTWQHAWSLQKGTWKTLRSRGKTFCGLMRWKLNSLAWMQSFKSGGNRAQLINHLTPSLPWSMVVAASCYGDVFQLQWDWETCKDRRNKEWSQVQTNPWGEPASECKKPETVVKIYIPTGQAHSQSNTGMASEQESESPCVAQPKHRLESHWESVERLEYCQVGRGVSVNSRAWAHLQGRIGENPQIQMCKAHRHTQEDSKL